MTSRVPDPRRPFGRLLTAMVSPMRADGALDPGGAARLATYLVDEQGNDGLVINGTTGEAPTTTDAEKEALLRAVLEAVGDRAHVVAGVGTNDTRHTIELARAAEKVGAHGTLVVTPYYNKPPQEGLYAHFTAVKDAKASMVDTATVTSRTGLAIYCGDDALTLPSLAVGAVGIVGTSTHFIGTGTKRMIEAYEAGDVAGALRLHRQLLPLFTGIFRTQGVILVKAGLGLLGLPSGPVRLPQVDATGAQIAQLRTDAAAAGVDLPEPDK